MKLRTSLFSTARGHSEGMQNIFVPGPGRNVDGFRVRAVATDGRFPFFVLSDSGVGYLLKVSFVNGKSWDESTRTKFFQAMEQGFKLENQAPFVDYTYSFSCVRRPLKPDELAQFFNDRYPINNMRTRNLAKMAEKLEVQATDMYFGLCASPSKVLKGAKVGFTDRLKSIWDKRIRYSVESNLLEDVVLQFGDKVKQVLALFAQLGIKTICPMTERDLLVMARRAWRPNYEPPGGTTADKEVAGIVLRSLREDSFTFPGDFLAKDLRVEQYKSHWISDGCFNMLFSLDEAPNPNIPFRAFECDRFMTMGILPGVSNIPYFGTYTVAWNSMTMEEGDFKFRLKNAFASGMVSNKKGMFEDKASKKEAREVDRMHEDYIEGGSDMVRACVTYQLAIPLEHLPRYFDVKASISDAETIRSIARTVNSQLNGIGQSGWRLEEKTYYPAWINSIPGAIRSVDGVQYLPRIYLPLIGTQHLIPLFATMGPDQKLFNGGNYFITDDYGILVFDHFSKSNGTAANFSVCGATGSGKSVTVQSLVMMTEQIQPYVMILDFGGGNVGSWTKLCAVSGGVELKFGSARPPRINPFQMAEADSFPNNRKRREIAIELGLDPRSDDDLAMIDTVFTYLRADDSPFTSADSRYKDIVDRCPAFASKTYLETMDLLKLGPGKCRPGEKGSSSIRIVLELLLATNVTEDGPTDNAWGQFLPDDINEAILELYETFLPPKDKVDHWPTLSDFKNTLIAIHQRRAATGGSQLYDDKGIFNFSLLMKKLSTFCRGGLDPFLDGQTNVNIRRKVVVDGVEVETPAKFILADMAGIADKRKLALYMVVINDFMSSILYNSKDARGIMIRDEAWFFMKSKISEPYLTADYRLARKYGFSVVTIAQNYSDFKSPVIQNNTQTWIVCSLASSDEIALADARFRFNDAEKELFERRRMGTQIERDVFKGSILDVYSRIMLSNASGKYFVRNKIGKEERWITTTDDSETFVYNYYKDLKFRGREAIDVIDWLCTGEYQKDADLMAALKRAGRVMPSI